MSLPAAQPSHSQQSLAVRAVLFDMDGTLVDSTAIVEQVWLEFAERYRLDYNEILRTSHGVQAGDTIRRYAPEGADVVALTAELGEMERNRTDGIIALPGAETLLKALPDDAIALVTSADRVLADIRMQAAGLTMPTTAVTAEAVTRGNRTRRDTSKPRSCWARNRPTSWFSKTRPQALPQPAQQACGRSWLVMPAGRWSPECGGFPTTRR